MPYCQTSIDLTALANRVAISGSAFAGFTLVFLGNAINSFQSFDAEDQGAVRPQFKRRAGLALAGFVSGIISSGIAISFHFLPHAAIAYGAAGFLVLSFVAVVIAAVWAYVTVW